MDFDRGLKPSKVHGQSLLPSSNTEKINLIGEYFLPSPDMQTSIQRPNHQGSNLTPRPVGAIPEEHRYHQGFLSSEDFLTYIASIGMSCTILLFSSLYPISPTTHFTYFMFVFPLARYSKRHFRNHDFSL